METAQSAAVELIEQSLAQVRGELLKMRTPGGHWWGELSSSALSTATGLFALRLFNEARCGADAERARRAALIKGGVGWLIANQNADGGWGDTTRSHSNISTTALCWAALKDAGDEAAESMGAAERWLTRAAGSLDPDAIARAITARYGKDRTFSVPILTMCALAGRLGESRKAWKHVVALPFELAVLPQSWFRFLRMPVVSYALPALISMGLARFRNRPGWNWLARVIRLLSGGRALKVLRTIQPDGGGFLEATPLTSFVVMSLAAAGEVDHPVVQAGVEFLMRSARGDGSWPIDTNLATWVTTLSVNGLAMSGGVEGVARTLSADERKVIREWLLAQQYRQRHPYTGADPGGWAWTDLPGGVPDADDTAGALLALWHLGEIDARVIEAAEMGIRWLLALQNGDGGIPTFCRGWTNLPFDRSGADLTAHALHGWQVWRDRVDPKLTERIKRAEAHALRYLEKTQAADGSWSPLWFGNQDAAGEENPLYGTAKVVSALGAMGYRGACVERGVRWLLDAQNSDGGWGGARGVASSIEETGLAVQALCSINDGETLEQRRAAVMRGARWLAERVRGRRYEDKTPIGFYFAKLWYFEAAYPLIFATGALGATILLLEHQE